MNHLRLLSLSALLTVTVSLSAANTWPDGSRMESWFFKDKLSSEQPKGRTFNICDYGAVPASDSLQPLQTKAIQSAIDAAHKAGGGTIIIPAGEFRTSSLFFKKGTKLYLQQGAILKGSDNIADYPYADVHIEGIRQQYIAALINAYGVDGFSISGRGTIDGNGLKYWKAYWERRKANPKCTNLEVLRPRLIYITDAKDVSIVGVSLKNPGFWTTHIYKCSKIRIKDVTIKAPTSGVKAPSSDGIDLDACSMVHITGCNISVNDDFIALKGGKGPYADTDTDNGADSKVLIEKCTFGAGPHVLTFGSECYKASNVILRDSKVNKTEILLRLKIRPDTPQEYSDILIENVSGYAGKLVHIRPWTQFYDLGDRKDIPMSYVRNVTVRGCKINAGKFLDIKVDSTIAQIEQPRMYDNDMFEINYSQKKVPPYTLPDPLTFADGSPVGDTVQWQARRQEILELFQNQMYGRMPKAEPIFCQTLKTQTCCAGFATRRDIRMWFRPDHSGPYVDWMVVTPRDTKGPFPVILTLNYDGNDSLPTDPNGRYVYPIGEMVARGYAFMTANYEDVAPDPDDTLQQKTLPFSKVATLWQRPADTLSNGSSSKEPARSGSGLNGSGLNVSARNVSALNGSGRGDNTGAIAAWAWALCRGMDMIQDDKALDGERVIVTGCSRLGKAALLAGAYDSRFSVVVPIQTGSGGVPLSKRNFGETVESSTTRYTHWFCKNYKAYARNESAMPFDQHLLLSCVAPRALLVLGFDNPWFDPYGEFLSVKAASPVWEFLGFHGLPKVDWPDDYSTAAIGDRLGYARRKRAHGISEYDWKWMLDFADKLFLGRVRTKMTNIFVGCTQESDLKKIERNLCEITIASGYEDSTVVSLVKNASEAGGWPDIDMKDQGRSVWSPVRHVVNLLDLAKAWNDQSGKFYRDSAVLNTFLRCYDYFCMEDPICPNWWYNEIGVPQDMGPALILMRGQLDGKRLVAGVKIMERSQFGRTGTNKVWLAVNVLMRGLLTNDEVLVKEAREEIFSEIKIAEREEGIRPDYSFQQHGPMLQIGNYGRHFLENMSWCAGLFKGTALALDENQLGILSDFFFKGVMPSIYKGSLDQNALARQVTDGIQRTKALWIADYVEALSKVDAKRAADYKDAAEAIKNSTNPQWLRGPYAYPYSDYGVFRAEGWCATVRMNSERVIGFETTNGENLRGCYSADGAVLVQVDGNEFRDIAPVWDWHLIPGTTTCIDGTLPWGNNPTRFTNNTDNVSVESREGMLFAAFEYDRDGVKARKSVICTPEMIVSRGENISCGRAGNVVTSVAQCHRSGEVYVSEDGSRVWHRGVGYINLSSEKFNVSTVTRHGSWSDIHTSGSKEIIEGQLFTLTISHGAMPRDAKYLYLMIPNVSLESFKKMPTPQIDEKLAVDWSALPKLVGPTIDNIEFDKGGLYK